MKKVMLLCVVAVMSVVSHAQGFNNNGPGQGYQPCGKESDGSTAYCYNPEGEQCWQNATGPEGNPIGPVCVNTLDDPDHCGSIGNQCGIGTPFCTNGVCTVCEDDLDPQCLGVIQPAQRPPSPGMAFLKRLEYHKLIGI